MAVATNQMKTPRGQRFLVVVDSAVPSNEVRGRPLAEIYLNLLSGANVRCAQKQGVDSKALNYVRGATGTLTGKLTRGVCSNTNDRGFIRIYKRVSRPGPELCDS